MKQKIKINFKKFIDITKQKYKQELKLKSKLM